MAKLPIEVINDIYQQGYQQGREDERERIIHLIEDGVWRDTEMLVEQIKEEKTK